MSIALDHMAFLVKNIDETIEFYENVLGLEHSERRIDRGLENAQIPVNDSTALVIWEGRNIQSQHFAFSVSASEFDEIFQRIRDMGVSYGNATGGYGQRLNMKGPDVEAGAKGDGKSLYFEDPNGHRLEILTYDDRD